MPTDSSQYQKHDKTERYTHNSIHTPTDTQQQPEEHTRKGTAFHLSLRFGNGDHDLDTVHIKLSVAFAVGEGGGKNF